VATEWYVATVRHGETEFNKEGRYAGSLDVPLNDSGIEDARTAAGKILSMHFDVCVSSPYVRAMETARLLTGGHVDIVSCPHARERNFGILQGRTSADVEKIRPPIHFIKVGGDYHSVDSPEAETFVEVQSRAQDLFRFISGRFHGKRVLVVSHGVFLQQFHGVLRDQEWVEALASHVRNLELTVFRLEGDRAVSEERVHLINRQQSSF
jgi:broad specificity phosphatase PhoE